MTIVSRTVSAMAHHRAPKAMVSTAVRPGERRTGDTREHLGWIRLVDHGVVPTCVCVALDEIVRELSESPICRSRVEWGSLPVVERAG